MRNKLGAICYLFLLVLISCEEPIDLKLDSTYPRLVVDGEVTTEYKKQEINLSLSTDYYKIGIPPAVSNAAIEISDGFAIYTFSEDSISKGLYLSDSVFAGVPGRTYTLSIAGVDINNDNSTESYQASSYMPDIVPIDSINITKFDFYGFYTGWQVNLFADEPVTDNYYLFKVYKNDTLLTDTLTEAMFSDDAFFNGSYMDGVSVSMHDDKNINDKLKIGDTVKLELSSLNKEYYNYLYDFYSTVNSSAGAFSMVAANPKNNFGTEMVVGYFNSRALSYSSYIVKK